MQPSDLISMLTQLTLYYSFCLVIFLCNILNIEGTLNPDEFFNVTELAAYLLGDSPLVVDVAHPPVEARVITDS